MHHIIPGIVNLLQHSQHLFNKPEDYMPSHCPHCGHNKLWKHGCYYRHPDRFNTSSHSLNPIAIPRFLCAACRRTCSALPECIPPRRWYLWETQEKILTAHSEGNSYRSIAKRFKPARSTIARWLNRFKAQFALHADHIRQYLASLRTVFEFKAFWQTLLAQRSLASVMCSCHVAGITIP